MEACFPVRLAAVLTRNLSWGFGSGNRRGRIIPGHGNDHHATPFSVLFYQPNVFEVIRVVVLKPVSRTNGHFVLHPRYDPIKHVIAPYDLDIFPGTSVKDVTNGASPRVILFAELTHGYLVFCSWLTYFAVPLSY